LLGSIVKILNSVPFSVVYLEHQLCAAVSAFAKVMDPPVTEDVLDMHPDTLNLVLEGFPAFLIVFSCFFLHLSLVLLGFWQFYSRVDGRSYPIQTLKTHRSALNRWMLHHKYGEKTVNTVVRLSDNYFLGSHQVFATRVCWSSLVFITSSYCI
jgi:hypothetical protein